MEPKSYADALQKRFPHDDAQGLYRSPMIPAGPLGKAFRSFRTISTPKDILGLHHQSGMLGSVSLAVTATHLHHDKGSIPLDDLRSAEADGNTLTVTAMTLGIASQLRLRCGSERAASLLARCLDDLRYQETPPELVPADMGDYSQYSPEAQLWLELRDEILRTLDQLHERFQLGRLNLMEYEEAKANLLRRL
jgi:hypothetical protein